MRVHFAAVIVEFVGLVIVGVFNEQFDRRRASLCGFDRVAKNFWRKLAAVDGNDSHARSDAGFGGDLTFDRVGDAAVVAEVEAKRGSGGNDVIHSRRVAQHFGRSLVVGELPSTAFDAAKRARRDRG